jgi:hypothetical protein
LPCQITVICTRNYNMRHHILVSEEENRWYGYP